MTIVSVYQVYFRKIQIIQPRSYVPGILALYLKKLTGRKILFDPRGLIPEELQLSKGSSSTDPSYLKWKKWEKRLLAESDKVLVLSNPFDDHYKAIQPAIEPIIVPCCVDVDKFHYDQEKRLAMRSKFLFNERLIVVYSMGHYVPYQDFDTAVALFKKIHSFIPNSYLMVLTPDNQAISNQLHISGIPLGYYSIYAADFSEMPNYLLMGDVGLLVRVPSIISIVSSPVKFAEYLACGLPVLTQPDIGNTENIVNTERVGRVINNNEISEETVHWINSLQNPFHREEMAIRCFKAAQKHYAWENYLDTYWNSYSDLMS